MQKAKLYAQSYSTIWILYQIMLFLTLSHELLGVNIKMCQL